MIIEALVVSVDYADYLHFFLDFNIRYFDHLIVVTDIHDNATIDLCKKYDGVECVQSKRLYENGDLFNKGKAINDGIDKLWGTGWVVLMDSDIILLPNFRKTFIARLDKNKLYGIPRKECHTYEWKQYLHGNKLQRKHIFKNLDFVNCSGKFKHSPKQKKTIKKYGSRSGTKILGYLQMFHHSNFNNKNEYKYSERYGHAGTSDIIFMQKWASKNRKVLRHMTAIHLAHGKPASNYRGRKSELFSIDE